MPLKQQSSTRINANNSKPYFSFNLTKEKLATMASKIYAAESSVYRTVGLFDQRMGQLTDAEVKDGKVVADAISEYAIECSMNKFFASEVLIM